MRSNMALRRREAVKRRAGRATRRAILTRNFYRLTMLVYRKRLIRSFFQGSPLLEALAWSRDRLR